VLAKPVGVVTTTETAPAAWAGVRNMTLPAVAAQATAVPPIVHVDPARLVPVIVTAVPPRAGPVAGMMVAMVGGGTG